MYKIRHKFLSVSSIGLASIACSCANANIDRPNVIIIYTDDVGFGDFSCNGSTTINTINVDRLAERGIRFTNAHTVASISTPARYGLLTGQYPWRRKGTGIADGDAGMIIAPEQYTMADMFHQAGYTTGAIGKWHLGIGETAKQDWNGTITPGLNDIGFDYSFIMAATADRVPCVFIENQQVVGLDPSDPIEVSYKQPFDGEPTGRDNPELLTKLVPSHGHDMAIVNGVSRIGWMKGGKAALWRDEDIADNICNKAVDYICKNSSSPFFLYLGTNDIHVPRVPNERFVGKTTMGARGDAIMSLDYIVGKILDTVDSLGITDNTVIILSSDNGPVIDDGYQDRAVELLGEHRPGGEFRGGKYSIFEAGTRIPMIIKWDKKHSHQGVSNTLVSHIDLLASLAELCNVDIPEGAATDSQDHLGAFMGCDDDREYIVEQSLTNTLSIVAGEWKYIEPSNRMAINKQTDTELGNLPKDQLYNMKDDSGERVNLAKRYPQKVAELKAILAQTKTE